jgi:hypothetical protein
MQVGVTLTHVNTTSPKADLISPNWILLDSGSTVSSIKNVHLLSDLGKSEELMRVFTSDGFQDYSEIGTLKLFPFNVYYNPQPLANILSLAQVSEMFRVTMDTAEAPTMMVHVSPDLILRFQQCGSGLYYYDTAANTNNSNVISYLFLSTVRNNKDYFNRQKNEGADKARILQGNIGWPSTKDMRNYIASNQIVNCNVTVDNVNRAEAINDPQVPLLKGKW